MSDDAAAKSDFKIIGIKVGKDCSEFVYKVLQRNVPYLLYPDYELSNNDNYSRFPSASNQLFSIEDGPDINISAIAGENGTGKSTVIEILFMIINNLANRLNIKNDLKEVQDLEATLFFKNREHYRLYIKGTNPSLQVYDKQGILQPQELFEDKKEILEDFYYTIAINYSHYAYNSVDLIRKRRKDWLTPLFHKNDSYQTPIVINPYRKEGVININSENYLVNQRLLANLLRRDNDAKYNFRLLTDHLFASHLWLRLNAGKDEVVYEEQVKDEEGERTAKWRMENLGIDYNAVLLKINEAININYNDGDYEETGQPFTDFAHAYLVRKLVTMAVKYQDYDTYFDKQSKTLKMDDLVDYVNRLLEDPSHIAYKFHQTINYLRFRHYKNQEIGQSPLELSDIAERIYNVQKDHPELELRIIDLLPPPIFEIGIFLSTDQNQQQKLIPFDTLSSGEKQLIYSISSILYHLSNLESVVSWNEKPKLKYPLINIVFEEIELYFHPELQRRFIKFLRDSIQRLELKTITAINMIFVTHSPFILSDIPTQNILFLKIKDKEAVQVIQQKKTFGANIHNLLSDSFFMHNGLCGAYAMDKINEIILALNLKKELQALEIKKSDITYIMPIAEAERYTELEEKIKGIAFERMPAVIDLIGEQIIAQKLRQMYDEAFGLDQTAWILKEIERLKGLLKISLDVSN